MAFNKFQSAAIVLAKKAKNNSGIIITTCSLLAGGFYYQHLRTEREASSEVNRIALESVNKQLEEAKKKFIKQNIGPATPEEQAERLFKKVNNSAQSIRADDVDWIKRHLSRKIEPDNQFFGVVSGPRGIGKTYAILTALNGFPGVIKILDVRHGTDKDVILSRVFNKICGEDNASEDKTRKIIEAYREKYNKRLIVVIPADEREIDAQPALLTQAARNLVERFKVEVLIDAGENALTWLTERESILYMEPMTDEMMCQIKEYEPLLDYLKSKGNKEVVLAACAGRPLLLNNLAHLMNKCSNEEDKEKAVRKFVENQLAEAHNSIMALSVLGAPMKKVIILYSNKILFLK